MGTPTDEEWEGVSKFPSYNSSFPRWTPICLQNLINFHSNEEEDFMKVREFF